MTSRCVTGISASRQSGKLLRLLRLFASFVSKDNRVFYVSQWQTTVQTTTYTHLAHIPTAKSSHPGVGGKYFKCHRWKAHVWPSNLLWCSCFLVNAAVRLHAFVKPPRGKASRSVRASPPLSECMYTALSGDCGYKCLAPCCFFFFQRAARRFVLLNTENTRERKKKKHKQRRHDENNARWNVGTMKNNHTGETTSMYSAPWPHTAATASEHSEAALLLNRGVASCSYKPERVNVEHASFSPADALPRTCLAPRSKKKAFRTRQMPAINSTCS